MARWSGMIGFAEVSETTPGVWEESITERRYYGDLLRNNRNLNNNAVINDRIELSNQISFIADPYATQNFLQIRYITFMGTKWRVRNVEVQFPRLVASLGDVYNEQTTD